VRPKGATPFRVSLVPAFNQCISPNRVHGAPLSNNSCAPPSQVSDQLTVGTPDANGQQANAIAWLEMRVVVGDPDTPADEADVKLDVSSTDVRVMPGLGDYAGELQASVMLRATDRASGPGADEPATTQDFPFQFAVPCQATASTSIGGACAVDTTADALTPGTVKESVRTIWQLGQVNLLDGGPDGVASTTPNAPFEIEGFFVP
jgi:hypothetical protein